MNLIADSGTSPSLFYLSQTLSLGCGPLKHGHCPVTRPTFPHGVWGFIARSIYGEVPVGDESIRTHKHTNACTGKGVRNANSDTQTGGVNPALIVNSARWLYCAAVSPFIQLSCHPSWLWRRAGTYRELPQEPNTHSNTQGLFAYTSTDSDEIQRPIMKIMT